MQVRTQIPTHLELESDTEDIKPKGMLFAAFMPMDGGSEITHMGTWPSEAFHSVGETHHSK
jgi:hypothetical protein